MVPFIDQLINEHGEALVDCLNWFLDDPEAFCKALPAGARSVPLLGTLIRKEGANFRALIEPIQLAKLAAKRGDLPSFPYALVFFSLDRLHSTLGVPKTLVGAFGAFSLESNLLTVVREEGWLHNALFGYRYFCNAQRRNVVEITVADSRNVQSTGTGFVSIFDDGRWRVFTCKHNLVSKQEEQYRVVSIKYCDGELKPIEILLFDRIDAAIIETSEAAGVNPIRMTSARILEPVYSAGFPKVLLTQASPLLFHRGDVNGWIGDIQAGSRAIVTSCDVAPGSSGGPLLNDVGQAVGIVHQRVETEFEDGKAKYGLAIPSDQLKHELDARFVSHVRIPHG